MLLQLDGGDARMFGENRLGAFERRFAGAVRPTPARRVRLGLGLRLRPAEHDRPEGDAKLETRCGVEVHGRDARGD